MKKLKEKIFENLPLLFLMSISFVVIALTVDISLSKPKYFSGEVISKSYTPSKNITGIGFSSSGKTVITNSFQSEKYILFVRNKKGEVLPVEAKAEIYFKKNEGHILTYYEQRGALTGILWFVKSSDK